MKKILEVNHLSVSFDTYAGEVQAIRDVAFDLQEQETQIGRASCRERV